MIRSLVGAVAWILIAGCANAGGRDPAPPSPVAIPRDAVKIGDDVYMAPLPTKIDGCPAFRQWSATKMVTQAIYYRGRAGGFVLDRAQANCD